MLAESSGYIGLFAQKFPAIQPLASIVFATMPSDHYSNLMDDMEYNCYLQWFDYLITNNKPQLDLIG